MILVSKTYHVRIANKDEEVVTIPPEFVLNSSKDRIWLYMDKKNRLIVSYTKLSGIEYYAQGKRPQKIRKGSSSYFISLPMSFVARNNIVKGDRVKMAMDTDTLVIWKLVDEDTEKN